MHPAYSVIFFTTASRRRLRPAGAARLLGAALGLLPPTISRSASIGLGLALGLISSGLLSSTAHLGHPERAWRALIAMALVLAVARRRRRDRHLSARRRLRRRLDRARPRSTAGWRSPASSPPLGAMVTVAMTGMIYASLKPVRAMAHAVHPARLSDLRRDDRTDPVQRDRAGLWTGTGLADRIGRIRNARRLGLQARRLAPRRQHAKAGRR